MKRLWKKCLAGCVALAGLSSNVFAQLSAPPVAAAPAVAPPGAVPAAAPAGPNLWTFLCPPPEKLAACKEKLCNSAIGQFINNGLRAPSAMSGGLVPLCCPAVSPSDLAKPPDSAEGGAAAVMADEADAPKRRAAVRILGRADCSRWPEAQAALINSLRFDRNECVRTEAALVLSTGCCCTRPIIKALVLTVTGGTEDGAPVERSPRVRAAAHAALDHCLSCFVEVEYLPPPAVIKEGPKEVVPPPKGDGVPPVTGARAVTPGEYYHRVSLQPLPEVVNEARRAVARVAPVPNGGKVSPALYQVPADRSITSLIQSAASSEAQQPMPTAAPPVMPPSAQTTVVPPVVQTTLTPPAPPAPVTGPMPFPPSMSTPTAPKSTPATTAVPTSPTRGAYRPEVPPLPDFRTSPAVQQPAMPNRLSAPLPPAPPAPPAQFVPPAPPAVNTTGTRRSEGRLSPLPTPNGVTQVAALDTTRAGMQAGTMPAARPGVEVIDTTRPVRPAPASLSLAPSPSPSPVPATPSPVSSGPALPTEPAKLVAVLANSPSVEQREMAAHTLGAFDRWGDQTVVQGLITAARRDAVAQVRAASVRALGRMSNRSAAVLSAVHALRGDPDPLVRSEAERAYKVLTQPDAGARASVK